MKKLIMSFCLSILIGTLCFANTVISAGNVSGTWTKSNSPYNITGDITIPLHTNLNIEPGVQIIFKGYYRINVFGSLVAKGTVTDSIYFMKVITDTAGLTDTITANGGWHSIIWNNPATGYQMSDSSIFNYCVFEYAKTIDSLGSGGAISINDYNNIKFSNCSFYKNVAKKNGGAIYITYSSDLIFQNCSFKMNQAKSGSGGAFFSDWGSRPIILNCTFLKNKCKADGGALWMISNNPVIQNCLFANNNAGGNGGAIYLNQSNAFIGNTVIANNKASGDGAIALWGSSPVFVNDNIVNNLAQTCGGLAFWDVSGAEFYNNIIWGNKNQSSAYSQIKIILSEESPVFDHCIIQPGSVYSGTIPAKSAIFTDTLGLNPLFISPTAGAGDTYDASIANWQLKITYPNISPAINAGISNKQTAQLSLSDFYNNSRVMNGFIDIGASEAHIGTISVNGTIKTNTIWIADTVLVTDNITIKDSVKLILSPGVKVLFQGSYIIGVQGTMIAIGDKEDSIYFTCPANLISTGWRGIYFDNGQYGVNGALTHNDTSYFKYCVFEFAKNMDAWQSGALNILYFSKVIISNSYFRNNSAYWGAAIRIDDISSPVVKNNIFYNNYAYANGGAILVNTKSQPIIMNNFITNNSCFGYIYSSGGGLYISNSSPVIVNNIISNNYSTTGGGLSIGNNGAPVFSNNAVIYNYSGTSAGGICSDITTSFDIYNSVFWGNHAVTFCNEIFSQYKVNIYNCNIQQYNGYYDFQWNDSANIISVDPGFIKLPFPLDSSGNGLLADYRISTFSGNINKGTTDIPGVTLPSTDIFGNPRINGNQIDIGAVENQGGNIVFINQPAGNSLCEGDTVKLSITVSDTANIQWQKDGINIPGATQLNYTIYGAKQYLDQGNYVCAAANAYGKVYSNPVFLQINTEPEISDQPLSSMVQKGSPITLEVRADGTKPLKYLWQKDGLNLSSDTALILKIDSFKTDNEGSYICKVTNGCGSIYSTPVMLSLAPSICMVTVSTPKVGDNGHNLIVWNKESKIKYSRFNIYRESAVAGYYDSIGSVSYTKTGIFEDTLVNPKQQAYLYKITAVDSNNVETDINLSLLHKTIHLITTTGEQGGIQLEWDQYIGFPYRTYYIYRSSNGKDFLPVDSIASSTRAWTDDTVVGPNDTLYYYISVKNPAGTCYPNGNLKAGSDIYSQSVSNMEDNRIRSTGITKASANEFNLSCHPNPFNNFTTISYNLREPSDVTLEIYNMIGEKLAILLNNIQQNGFNHFQFIPSTYNLSSGIYILKMKAGNTVDTKRLVELK